MAIDATPGSADDSIETSTVKLTKTVKCRLQTSDRKNAKVREAIDDWQRVASYAADMMPSVEEHRWGEQGHTQQVRLARHEFDDLCIYAHDRDAAVRKVSESFASWRENGKPGPNPAGEFGDGDYLRMCSCSSCPGAAITEESGRYAVVPNDEGYGLWLKFHRDGGEWFHVDGGAYQHRYLQDVVDGAASLGNAELRLDDAGTLYCHIAISADVEVLEVDHVERWVGVDLRDRTLYTAVVMDSEGSIGRVEIESGAEFRHHRERISEFISELSEAGSLSALRGMRQRRRYTDQVTHSVSRQIVDMAAKEYPAGIVMEDLTGMRESVANPIHDWPYGEIVEKVAYKAMDAGVPVVLVEPYDTTVACRKCGETEQTHVDYTAQTFRCGGCGYVVHVGVNSAANVAAKRIEDDE